MSVTVKVQCPCGARFAFEVEPVEGRLPVPVHCPECGADATGLANAALAGWTAGEGVTASESGRPRVRLRSERSVDIAAASPRPGESPQGPARCPQHPDEPAVERCRVCGRPICRRCMELHGYVCSVLCAGRAEREGIEVPEYAGRRDRVIRRRQRWVRTAAVAVAVLGLGTVGGWVWSKWWGSRPRTVFVASVQADELSSWELLRPEVLLSWNAREAVLRVLPEGRVLWRVPWEDGERDELPRLLADHPYLCWLRGARLFAIDSRTGQRRWQVELPSPVLGVRWDDQAAVAVSGQGRGPRTVTRVELATGAAKREVVIPTPVPRPLGVALGSETRPARVPTAADAAAFLEEDPQETDTAPPRHEFYPAGAEVVEFQTWLIQRNISIREGLKPKEAPSVLESDRLTAGRSWEAVREALDDLRRARTGSVVKEDRSRYGVRLRRWMGTGPTEWTGEIVGPPWWVPLRSVDVLLGATQLLVFEKSGRLRWTAALAFPVSPEILQQAETAGHGWPCLEVGPHLCVFDQGMLTCFELTTGRVRWRLPSVGIARVHEHEGRVLYVCTTTATVDDLAHPLQVKLLDKPQPLLLKVEADTGRVLWRQARLADRCFPTGSYLYAWWFSRGMSGEGTFFNLYRLDPRTGVPLWHEYTERWPRRLAFHAHRFLVQWEDRIEVREFRSH
jgi:hypothetical protein